MQAIEHIVFIVLMVYVGLCVIWGGYTYIKKKFVNPMNTNRSLSILSKRQKELNETFEIILDEHEKIPPRTAKPTNTSKPSRMAQAKAKYAKAYQPWTKEEDDSLKRMYAHSESMAAMKLVFQRGEGAIRSRIKKICI